MMLPFRTHGTRKATVLRSLCHSPRQIAAVLEAQGNKALLVKAYGMGRERMPGYSIVPVVSGNAAYDLWQTGLDIGNGNGIYFRIGKSAGLDFEIRIVALTNSGLYFAYLPVFETGNAYVIMLNNGSYSVNRTISIGNSAQQYNGYMWQYTGYNMPNYDIPVYSTEQECLDALTSTPIINPGVHVTFNPVYIPSFPGVHVRFNPVNTNPYAPGGDSETGGGGGQFILEDDSIHIPDLPSLNTTDTHFIRAYKPDLTMLQAFQRWLWQDNPFQSWVNVLGNPYDYIVGLLAIPKTPTTGSAERPVLGNVKAPDSMPKITNQFVRHDFGTITFNEYSHSYLDYSPYTKITLYLPYIGFVPIDADYINRQTVNVQYTIDVFTGSFVAYVIVAGKVLYTYNGMMGVHVPITNQTYNNFIGGLIGIAGTIGSMIATEGATAPLGAASIASTATNILKPTVEHGNNLTGTPGVMSVQYPYFIIKRPAQSIPERMQTFTGFPSNTLKSLGDVRGFTKVEYIHIENISATEDEKAEIMSLLKEGVIF